MIAELPQSYQTKGNRFLKGKNLNHRYWQRLFIGPATMNLLTMNLLAWNCCGLRNLCTKRELVEIIWAKYLSIVFISETWTNEVKLIKLSALLILIKNGWSRGQLEESSWCYSGRILLSRCCGFTQVLY